MEKIPLSVVVLTKNEANNIGPCLASVSGWADEILVVDDESSDGTAALAEGRADRVLRRRMDNEGEQRNWAYAQARNEWVLSLDADETVSDGLKDEIIQTLPASACAAFTIPLKNYIGSYWVRYSGWYPARKLRLFRKNKFRYEEAEVHPRAFVDGQTGHLNQDIVHKGYPDFAHFLDSLNRQTTLEARKWLRTGQQMPFGRVLRRTADRFLRVYIKDRGIKDGFIGFMIACFASFYQLVSYAKYWEMKKNSIKRIADRG